MVLESINKIDGLIEFEVGSGESIEIREFVKILLKLTGSLSKLKFGAIPTRKDEIMNSKANINNLKLIGWSLNYDLNNGLKKMIEKEKLNSNNF